MRNSNKFYFILIYFSLSQNLFGYLDPGSLSSFFQVLIMLFVGGLVAIKTFWQNIKIFFQNLFNKKK